MVFWLGYISYRFLGTWIVADMDIPPMEKLIIWGVLEMEDKSEVGAAGPAYRKVVLNATYISVQVRVKSYNLHYSINFWCENLWNW